MFVCIFSSVTVYAEDYNGHKNVLIINSYHEGFAWSKAETDGIIHKLRDSYPDVSTYIEYMDWKNYPTSENLKHLQVYYKYKYQNKNIDVLVATDDIALQFVLENREELFSNAPVVFCGVVKNNAQQIINGYKKVTGVFEEVDPTETIKIALNINPSLKNIYLLYDNMESGTSIGDIVINKINSMNLNLNVIPLNNLPYEDLIKSVGNFNKKDSIILLTTYYMDGEGKIVEFENVSRELGKNSNVPVYQLYDSGLNSGAIGGVMVSGKLQGETAAVLATRILDGADPDELNMLSPELNRKAFDYKQLQRFGISLKKIPKDSELINKPFSFFETYKVLVLRTITAFIIIIILVIILLCYIILMRRMKRRLMESNEELTLIYEELAASDEELKTQYNEILNVNEKLRISEEKLAHLAYHDILTGLPNKLSLYNNSSLCDSVPGDKKFALLFIDMDNFKYINDTMGHAFGDCLLMKISDRMNEILKSNFLIYSIYRLSGDEFVIILEDINGEGQIREIVSRIIKGFKEEFEVKNSVLYVSLSIGISFYPEHGNALVDLIKYADIAMYKAKESGRNNYVIYDNSMNEIFTERMNIERFLYKALNRNEFSIFYQPQYDINLDRITGFEALMRWVSPELGNVPPLKFIKVAEDTHLIIEFGTWVLKSACFFIKKLHNKGYKELTVAVNISILQLLQTDFYDVVMEALSNVGLEPQYLELEITESLLMESYGSIGSKLESLREAGVGIALDDFGKGYSSLSYLKQLPISTLKIDKSFIDDITSVSECQTLTGQIVTLGKIMNMSIVAEGVEKQEQLDYLINHNCNKIQGYICSKPLPENEVEKLLSGLKNPLTVI